MRDVGRCLRKVIHRNCNNAILMNRNTGPMELATYFGGNLSNSYEFGSGGGYVW